jgi:cytosine/adenosine deaminase-related metal-dependent hydrolase
LLDQYPGTGVLFRELIGLGGARLAEQREHARRHMSRAAPPLRANWTFALSPHAPYTAALELIHEAVELSCCQRVPVALHLAESLEELELLATGSGPFRELLERFEVWNPAAFPGGRAPADYLQALSRAPRGLVIHGNYLDDNDWRYLADHRDTLSAVYCPRTHDYFQHPRYPLSRMLDRGARVVLGTDGRASTCNLNLFEELQFAAARHGDVAPRQLLRMVTIEAAIALGCESRVGSLAAGKRADLIAVPLPRSPRSGDDPYATLLDAGQRISAVWCGGSPVQVPEE